MMKKKTFKIAIGDDLFFEANSAESRGLMLVHEFVDSESPQLTVGLMIGKLLERVKKLEQDLEKSKRKECSND